MERRFDLDWVRVCAFALLVVYHVGMYYVSWDWHVNSPHASRSLEPLMMLSSPWRLALLFLVSGVATSFLLAKAQRKAAATGRAAFFGARSWRLLVPLLFGMFVVVPPQSFYEYVEKAGYADGYLGFYPLYLGHRVCIGDDCLLTPTWNHLWFVAYLWVYTMFLGLVWRLAPTALDRLSRRLDHALSSVTAVVLWPVAFFALARVGLIGMFEPSHALVDDWYNHVQYFGAFLLGFLIARGDRVWPAIARARWTALALWLASWLAIAAYFNHFVEVAPSHGLRLAMRAAWGLNQWCAVLAILGFARTLNPGDSAVLRYLSTAVFPVYILHQTVTIALAHHLKPLDLAATIEGPLLIALTLVLCLAGHELIRRVRPLRPLFGLARQDRHVAQGRPAHTARRTPAQSTASVAPEDAA